MFALGFVIFVVYVIAVVSVTVDAVLDICNKNWGSAVFDMLLAGFGWFIINLALKIAFETLVETIKLNA